MKLEPMKVKIYDDTVTVTDKVYGPLTKRQKESMLWHMHHDVSYYFSKRGDNNGDSTGEKKV